MPIPTEFQVSTFDPSRLAPFQDRASPTAWVVRMSAPQGGQYVINVEPPEGATDLMNEVSTPAIVADMLRPGWLGKARAYACPVLADEKVYRGFRMTRTSELFPESSGAWMMECLVSSSLRAPFDWNSCHAELDAFHVLVFGGPEA